MPRMPAVAPVVRPAKRPAPRYLRRGRLTVSRTFRMSILALILGIFAALAATAATAPASAGAIDQETGLAFLLGLLVFTALGLGLAKRFAVWRPASIIGPARLPDRGGMGALVIVT